MGGRGRRLQPGQVSTSRSHTDELVGGAGDRAGRARQGHVGSAAAAAAAVGPSDQKPDGGDDKRGRVTCAGFLCIRHHFHFVRHVILSRCIRRITFYEINCHMCGACPPKLFLQVLSFSLET